MAKLPQIRQGMELRDALAVAKAFGCVVDTARSDGELHLVHPASGRKICQNNRRKDASTKMVSWLRQLSKIEEQEKSESEGKP